VLEICGKDRRKSKELDAKYEKGEYCINFYYELI
jgi:hypothetical protein